MSNEFKRGMESCIEAFKAIMYFTDNIFFVEGNNWNLFADSIREDCLKKEKSMIPKFKPRDQNIVIRLAGRPNTTRSGLHLPDVRHPDKIRQGVVESVGPGKFIECNASHRPMEVAVGDKLIFNEFTGTKTEHDGVTFLHMKEDDVWCVVEGEIELEEVTDRGQKK